MSSKNVKLMNCYICNSSKFNTLTGTVRDAPEIKILSCKQCGLVSLSQSDHIVPGFYENSGMFGEDIIPIDTWLKETVLDDRRRFEMIKNFLPNKSLLDFGCGSGGFLVLAKELAHYVTGVELETRVREYWSGKLDIVSDMNSLEKTYDLITGFHVIEHLKDPREILSNLALLLNPNGRIIVEVPNCDDALITLYNSDAFKNFTYWSQHLYLFNAKTLETLGKQAGLRVVAVEHIQRYPLSNHLYWLSEKKPKGHQIWSFLDTPELKKAYSKALALIGKTDTLIAHFELPL